MTNIVAVEVQEGSATAIRACLAQIGIKEPVEIRILWKESHSHGLLYRMKLHQPLDPTVITTLGQEAGVCWWYQEGQLNAYIPEAEPKAPADLLWGALLEHDPHHLDDRASARGAPEPP